MSVAMTGSKQGGKPREPVGKTGKVVAVNVARLRVDALATQQQLADLMTAQGRRMTVAIVSQIERGLRHVDIDDIEAFAAVFGVTLMSLTRVHRVGRPPKSAITPVPGQLPMDFTDRENEQIANAARVSLDKPERVRGAVLSTDATTKVLLRQLGLTDQQIAQVVLPQTGEEMEAFEAAQADDGDRAFYRAGGWDFTDEENEQTATADEMEAYEADHRDDADREYYRLKELRGQAQSRDAMHKASLQAQRDLGARSESTTVAVKARTRELEEQEEQESRWDRPCPSCGATVPGHVPMRWVDSSLMCQECAEIA